MPGLGQGALIAATGIVAQQAAIRQSATNMSNLVTTAYQAKYIEFSSVFGPGMMLSTTTAAGGDDNIPNNISQGLGVKIQGESTNLQQGEIKMTEQTYDLAIQGKGYFTVRLPDGQIAYTRAGNFRRNNNGTLVTSSGYELDPPITIPMEAVDVNINEKGEVFVRLAGENDSQNLGQIQLSMFANPGALEAKGDYYLATQGAGEPSVGNPGIDGRGTLLQGALEGSNVQAINEMMVILEAQNAYSMLLKFIEGAKTMGEQLAKAA